MSSSNLTPHLVYLTDAAHLLAVTAPETSAYLMRRRNGLMIAADLPQSDVQKQHVCGACGHIMVIGQGDTTLQFESDTRHYQGKSSKSKPKSDSISQGSKSGPSKLTTCGLCGRHTKVKLPPPTRAISRKKATKATATAMMHDVEAKKPAPSANASSKKRAKSRKAGLQALLDQTHSNRAQAGLGLSLADFMKK
jgi:hypothetical protein